MVVSRAAIRLLGIHAIPKPLRWCYAHRAKGQALWTSYEYQTTFCTSIAALALAEF